MTQYASAMRSLLSECQTVLWCRRTSNFIYAHNKSTTLPSSILLKVVHAQQHYAQLSNPQSDPNRTINVDCTIINQLTNLSEARLSLCRFPRDSNHAILFVDPPLQRILYKLHEKCTKSWKKDSITTLSTDFPTCTFKGLIKAYQYYVRAGPSGRAV